jgi:hypothetical protein
MELWARSAPGRKGVMMLENGSVVVTRERGKAGGIELVVRAIRDRLGFE